MVLGVPFYGRPGWAGYGDILAADPDAGNKDHAMVSGDVYKRQPLWHSIYLFRIGFHLMIVPIPEGKFLIHFIKMCIRDSRCSM